MEEIFDILDENGNVTGKTASRSYVHSHGLYHRTVHIWIIRDGKLLLQRRSHNKDSFPDKLDISSAGHIDAGEEPLTGAVRELYEELGIKAEPWEFVLAGRMSRHYVKHFRGKIFDDNELAYVYIYTGNADISQVRVQESEISGVELCTYEECLRLAADDDEPLYLPELEMIGKYCDNKR